MLQKHASRNEANFKSIFFQTLLLSICLVVHCWILENEPTEQTNAVEPFYCWTANYAIWLIKFPFWPNACVCEKMVLCGNHHLQKSISLNRVPSNSDDLHKMVVHVQWAHWNKANRVLNHFAVFALCRLVLHLILLKFDFSSKHTMGAHDFTQFWKLVR